MRRVRLRTVLGVALIVLGLPPLLVGSAAAVYIGPDDTVQFARADVGSDGAVISTAVSLPTVTGPVLHVSANAGSGETFVGVAHRIHVDSYLDGVAQQTVAEVSLRGDITSEAVEGSGVPAAPPGDLDWWQESSSGAGWQTVSFELTDEPVRVVITQPDPSGSLEVSLGIGAEIDGVFVTAVLVGVAGLLLVAGGVLVFWLQRRRRKRELSIVPAPASPKTEPDEDRVATVTPLPRRPLPKRTPPPPAPEPPPKPETPKPSARVRVLVGLGLSGLVAGCAQVPQEIEPGDRTSSIRAITFDRAIGFFTQYNEINNEANATMDPGPLADVEGGTLLETSRFAYEEQAVTGTAPAEPFTVTPSVVLSPQVDAYPMWSVVTTEPAAGGAASWYLLTRENAATPWLASLAVHPAAGTSVTAPLMADGAVVVADEDAVTRGQEVLEALRQFGETGEEPEHVDLTNANGLSLLPDHGLQLDTAPPEFGSSTRSCAVENPDSVHWMQTEYGAVAMASISCTQTMTANPGYTVVIEADGLGTIPGGSEIAESQISQSASFILSVDTDGSATVVGQRMQPLAMTWSLP